MKRGVPYELLGIAIFFVALATGNMIVGIICGLPVIIYGEKLNKVVT